MLGDELRKARMDAEMTQEQLSFAAQIDRTYVSHLERNMYSPTLDVLFRVCDAIGIKTAVLIRRVERSRQRPHKGINSGGS